MDVDTPNGDCFWPRADCWIHPVDVFLPESESTIEERLFSEITYQMSELKDVTDHLVHSRETVSGTMQQQIDDHLQQAAEWLVSFQPSGDTHEHRKAT